MNVWPECRRSISTETGGPPSASDSLKPVSYLAMETLHNEVVLHHLGTTKRDPQGGKGHPRWMTLWSGVNIRHHCCETPKYTVICVMDAKKSITDEQKGGRLLGPSTNVARRRIVSEACDSTIGQLLRPKHHSSLA